MSTKLTSIVLAFIISPLVVASVRGQDRAGADPYEAASVRLDPSPAAYEWVTYNRVRWFWYMPQEWQFPGFLQAPALLSPEPMGATQIMTPRWGATGVRPTATEIRERSDLNQPARPPAQAYRWNEATGRAEPIELQRWGGGQISGVEES